MQPPTTTAVGPEAAPAQAAAEQPCPPVPTAGCWGPRWLLLDTMCSLLHSTLVTRKFQTLLLLFPCILRDLNKGQRFRPHEKGSVSFWPFFCLKMALSASFFNLPVSTNTTHCSQRILTNETIVAILVGRKEVCATEQVLAHTHTHTDMGKKADLLEADSFAARDWV